MRVSTIVFITKILILKPTLKKKKEYYNSSYLKLACPELSYACVTQLWLNYTILVL